MAFPTVFVGLLVTLLAMANLAETAEKMVLVEGGQCGANEVVIGLEGLEQSEWKGLLICYPANLDAKGQAQVHRKVSRRFQLEHANAGDLCENLPDKDASTLQWAKLCRNGTKGILTAQKGESLPFEVAGTTVKFKMPSLSSENAKEFGVGAFLADFQLDNLLILLDLLPIKTNEIWAKSVDCDPVIGITTTTTVNPGSAIAWKKFALLYKRNSGGTTEKQTTSTGTTGTTTPSTSSSTAPTSSPTSTPTSTSMSTAAPLPSKPFPLTGIFSSSNAILLEAKIEEKAEKVQILLCPKECGKPFLTISLVFAGEEKPSCQLKAGGEPVECENPFKPGGNLELRVNMLNTSEGGFLVTMEGAKEQPSEIGTIWRQLINPLVEVRGHLLETGNNALARLTLPVPFIHYYIDKSAEVEKPFEFKGRILPGAKQFTMDIRNNDTAEDAVNYRNIKMEINFENKKLKVSQSEKNTGGTLFPEHWVEKNQTDFAFQNGDFTLKFKWIEPKDFTWMFVNCTIKWNDETYAIILNNEPWSSTQVEIHGDDILLFDYKQLEKEF